MSQLGLGRLGWGIVALMTALNVYALVPEVSGLDIVAVLIGVPIGAFVWVHFLKTILMAWVGGGEPAAAAESDA